jgi:hypothetical protein
VLTLQTLFEEHISTQERKLYEAMVALAEGAELAEKMAMGVSGEERDELNREADQLRRGADAIRNVVEERPMSRAN